MDVEKGTLERILCILVAEYFLFSMNLISRLMLIKFVYVYILSLIHI